MTGILYRRFAAISRSNRALPVTRGSHPGRFFEFTALFAALLIYFLAPVSGVASAIPEELKGVGITEHPGESVLLQDLRFRDEAGQVAPLAQYFNHGKPVVLVLAYYECPNLCTFVLNGLVESLQTIP